MRFHYCECSVRFIMQMRQSKLSNNESKQKLGYHASSNRPLLAQQSGSKPQLITWQYAPNTTVNLGALYIKMLFEQTPGHRRSVSSQNRGLIVKSLLILYSLIVLRAGFSLHYWSFDKKPCKSCRRYAYAPGTPIILFWAFVLLCSSLTLNHAQLYLHHFKNYVFIHPLTPNQICISLIRQNSC